jgi:hypothetical protein
MDKHGYGQNTLTWLATDNGPEKNCGPEGRCDASHYRKGPGSSNGNEIFTSAGSMPPTHD